MFLSELKIGEVASIKKINFENAQILSRLSVLGFSENAIVTPLAFSYKRSCYIISVKSRKIAIAYDIAHNTEVKKIEKPKTVY